MTQFDSKKKVISKEKIAKNGLEDKSSQGDQTQRKQIVIKGSVYVLTNDVENLSQNSNSVSFIYK